MSRLWLLNDVDKPFDSEPAVDRSQARRPTCRKLY